MDITEIMPIISRWLHIIPAIILFGGTLFMRFSLAPSMNENSASAELREAIRKRWAKLVMASILFLLASGLYNSALKAIDYKLDGVYLTLLTIKILFGFAIFFLLSVLSGRSARAQKFREREIYWLNIICTLMLVVVLSAGYMKMQSYPEKPPKDADESAMLESDNNFEISSQAVDAHVWLRRV